MRLTIAAVLIASLFLSPASARLETFLVSQEGW